jgi:hypothetical protein
VRLLTAKKNRVVSPDRIYPGGSGEGGSQHGQVVFGAEKPDFGVAEIRMVANMGAEHVPMPYPFVRRIWCSDLWRPPETVKMTSNECCDDIGWRAYLGTSQRNHDHPPLDGSCVHSASEFELNVEVGTVLNMCPPVVSCGMVLALNWSLHFFLLKRYFSEILRLPKRKRGLLRFASFLCPSRL